MSARGIGILPVESENVVNNTIDLYLTGKDAYPTGEVSNISGCSQTGTDEVGKREQHSVKIRDGIDLRVIVVRDRENGPNCGEDK